MEKQIIIFDLDGTLIDTMGKYADKAADLIAEFFNLTWDIARKSYLETSGLPFRHQLELLFPESGLNNRVSDYFEDWKNHYLRDGYPLATKKRVLLNRLKDQGFIVAISSNNAQTHVSSVSRDWPVDIALGYRDDEFRKGESHFAWFEQNYKIPRQKMLFVGDSPKDAMIAESSHVEFAALLSSNFHEQNFRSVSPGVICLADLNDLADLVLS